MRLGGTYHMASTAHYLEHFYDPNDDVRSDQRNFSEAGEVVADELEEHQLAVEHDELLAVDDELLLVVLGPARTGGIAAVSVLQQRGVQQSKHNVFELRGHFSLRPLLVVEDERHLRHFVRVKHFQESFADRQHGGAYHLGAEFGPRLLSGLTRGQHGVQRRDYRVAFDEHVGDEIYAYSSQRIGAQQQHVLQQLLHRVEDCSAGAVV